MAMRWPSTAAWRGILTSLPIPWTDEATDAQTVVDAITGKYAIRVIGEPEHKKHGRIAYTVSLSFGDVALDLSFMPRQVASQ